MRSALLLLLVAAFAFPAGAQASTGQVSVAVVKESGRGQVPATPVYGPFRVISPTTAEMVGVTDGGSPQHFAAMLRNHPGIATLDMIDCPGTEDDLANLQLGRMIRAAGIATRVPQGGSVRSGAVELFLAGTVRELADGAEFAVHAWIDEEGREASEVPAGSPSHRRYMAYYRDMGLGAQQAAAFYAMTNSARFDAPRWLTGKEMRQWIAAKTVPVRSAPMLAYLDLDAELH